MSDKDHVCADCGTEQGDGPPCVECGGFRVILISEAARIFGDNWRAKCFPAVEVSNGS